MSSFVKQCHQHVIRVSNWLQGARWKQSGSIKERQKHTIKLAIINLFVKYFFKKLCMVKCNITFISNDIGIALSKFVLYIMNKAIKIHIHFLITNHSNLSHLLRSASIWRKKNVCVSSFPLEHTGLGGSPSGYHVAWSSFICKVFSSGLWGWWRGCHLKHNQRSPAVITAQQEISLF